MYGRVKHLKEVDRKKIEECPGKLLEIDNVEKNRYFITEEGKVYDRYLDKFLNSHINTGYNRVTLRTESNTQKSYYNHVLTAVVYFGDYRSTMTVNHESGDKSDNSASNLKWMTHHENITHAIANGLIKNRTSLTEPIVRQLCELVESGKTSAEIAALLGLNYATVNNIRNKYNWTHVSSEYKFPPKLVYKMLTPDLIDIILDDIKEGTGVSDIAKKHGVNIYTLHSFKRKYEKNPNKVLNKKNYKKQRGKVIK